jgi:methionyl-tRNA formyltransferase
LLSFGTRIIVPGTYLERTGLIAANIHAASPSFPGRDPHHYAIYEAVTEYGATLHFMTHKVDEGPIIAIKSFSVSGGDTAISLLEKANECGWQLVEQLLVWLKDGVILTPSVHLWSGTKRSRKDLG